VLDGPRLAPASGRPAKGLVVFVHGYGADGNDLIELGRHFARDLPDIAFVAPHAPEPCAMSPGGRQWFPLTMRDPAEVPRGVARAAPVLEAFLSQELGRMRLPASALALVGFSQGTMMALDVGLARRPAIAAIVGFSGLLARPETLAAAPRPSPPVVLVHGDQDDVLPVEYLPMACEALAAAEIPVEWHISPGLSHGIDEAGLAIAASVLRRALPR
jgi:phospholipase/carboxylesterase